jgi:hypothetical protein
LMCLRARFNISKPMIIRSSHEKYEYQQVWSLLQYRELENTETYTKAHQNMKNNWIRLCTVTRHMLSPQRFQWALHGALHDAYCIEPLCGRRAGEKSTKHMSSETFPFPTVNAPFQT